MSKQTLSSFYHTQEILNLQREFPLKNSSPLRAKVQNDPGKSKTKNQTNSLPVLFPNKNSIKSFQIFIFLIIYFSLFSLYMQTDNYITVTYKGTGAVTIINSTYISSLSSIQINPGSTIAAGSINQVQSFTSDSTTIQFNWNSQLSSCSHMFKGLNKIISIDLTHFDFTSVTEMNSFFEGCTSLSTVDLRNNEAPNVLNMNFMFRDCTNLLSVHLSGFNAVKVKDLSFWFFECPNITSIDLSSFNTPDLLSLVGTFSGCRRLTNLKFGNNFKTSKVTDMALMFQNCNSLSSIDLSKFDTTSVIKMDQMFDQCISLTSLDLSSFRTPSLKHMYAMLIHQVKM